MKRAIPPSFAHEHFRAAQPMRVVIDVKLGGAPALLLGHWVDDAGREIAAHVLPLGSRRRLFDIRDLPPAPATKPIGDNGR